MDELLEHADKLGRLLDLRAMACVLDDGQTRTGDRLLPLPAVIDRHHPVLRAPDELRGDINAMQTVTQVATVQGWCPAKKTEGLVIASKHRCLLIPKILIRLFTQNSVVIELLWVLVKRHGEKVSNVARHGVAELGPNRVDQTKGRHCRGALDRNFGGQPTPK